MSSAVLAATASSAPTPAVRWVNVTKRFPGVVALDDVTVEVAPGTCHALCGENGAGKSTLSKLLAGIYRPDAGEIFLHGRPVSFDEPRDALEAGIGMVHQELSFCENMTVAENLCLNHLPRAGSGIRQIWLDRRAMCDRAEALIADVAGIDAARIDVGRTIGELTVGERQLVQIAAAVGSGATLLILDEPTSSLSEHEAKHLYDLIDRLKARGVTLVYVSHRMHELFQLCDAVTVLRDGRHVDTRPIGQYTETEIIQQMVGRAVEGYVRHRPPASEFATRPVRLSVEQLRSLDKFTDISFQVRAGEIVGFAGLIGAGRSQVIEALFGLDPAARGRVRIDDSPAQPVPASPEAAMQHGMGLVPEDRKKQGLVLMLSGRENLTLPLLRRLAQATVVRRSKELEVTQRYFERLRVRAPSVEAPVSGLSGGNQQKIVLARWLAAGCRVLFLDEPTRGVDVGAKAEIHALIDELARDGVAVVLVSSELPELLALADRIIVMREGHRVAELPGETTQDTVLRWMTGVGA